MWEAFKLWWDGRTRETMRASQVTRRLERIGSPPPVRDPRLLLYAELAGHCARDVS